jgi:hypothetical protein
VKIPAPDSSLSPGKPTSTPRKATFSEPFIAGNSDQPESWTIEPISRMSPSWAMTVSPPPEARITSCMGPHPVKVPGKKPIPCHETVLSEVLMLEFIDQWGCVAPVVPPPDVWKLKPISVPMGRTVVPPG